MHPSAKQNAARHNPVLIVARVNRSPVPFRVVSIHMYNGDMISGQVMNNERVSREIPDVYENNP